MGAALTAALVVGAFLVKAATGAFVPWATALRVAVAIAVTVSVIRNAWIVSLSLNATQAPCVPCWNVRQKIIASGASKIAAR